MKRAVFGVMLPALFLAYISLWYTACPGLADEPSGEEEELPAGPVTGPYAETFWGEWIRVDTGDTWYISGRRILINGTAASKTYDVTKQSPQVIKVTESGETYFLFASRTANATLRGKVIVMGDLSDSGRAPSSVGQIPPFFEIINPQQPEMPPVTVQPDQVTGKFEVPNQIPGEGLVATPMAASGGVGKLPPIPVPGLPIPPPDNSYEPPEVPIPVVAEGVNLKAHIRPADERVDATLLYADGISREFYLEVENVGTQDCTAATYSLDWDPKYLSVIDPSPNQRLGTLSPKQNGGDTYKKSIPITVTCKPLPDADGAYKDIEIKVNISYRGQIWEDSDSIRYNKAKIPFRIGSDLPVQGIIKVPGGITHHFRTSGMSDGIYKYTIDLPWSTENYFVIFSGAEVGDEPVYSLGINAPFPSRLDFDTFNDTWRYEGVNGEGHNDDEEHAVLIESKNSIMAYLHGGVTETSDIDFYQINLGNEVPVVKLVPMELAEFREDGGNGDGRINPGETVHLDMRVQNATSQSRSVTASLSPAADYAGFITIQKGTSTINNLGPGFYATLSSSGGSSSGAGLFSPGGLSNTLRFSLSESCPAGISIPLTLSFVDSLGISWTETVELAVEERDKSIAIEMPLTANCVLTEYSGNGDNDVNPGESFYYDINVKNTGTVFVPGLQGVLSSTASAANITLDTASVGLGFLVPGSSVTVGYRFTVSPDCPPGTEIPWRLTFSSGTGQIWWDTPPALTVKVPAPGGLQAAALSTDRVSLNWNSVSGAAAYRVYFAAAETGPYSFAGSAAGPSYTHSGLAAGTVYYYRVTATAGSAESSPSPVVSVKTWARLPAFNKEITGSVSAAGHDEYYRFYVSSGTAYTLTSDGTGTVIWENGTHWFSFYSGPQTQIASTAGWAVIKIDGLFTFKVKSGEAAVSGFSIGSSTGTLSEADKTIAVLVPYGTNLSPTVTPAPGWTCLTTGAQDFSSPVEYIFTKGDAAQAYMVTVTVMGQGGIIIDPPGSDISIAGFPLLPITVSRNGSPQTHTIQISDTSYSSYEWYVDDEQETADSGSIGRAFTINAADYVIGPHTVTLIVRKNNVPWSNEQRFTVTN